MNKNKTVAATAEQKSLEASLRLGVPAWDHRFTEARRMLGDRGSGEPGPDMDEAVTSL